MPVSITSIWKYRDGDNEDYGDRAPAYCKNRNDIFMPAKAYSAKDRIVLERVAQTCPVYYSLNEHLEKSVRFHCRYSC